MNQTQMVYKKNERWVVRAGFFLIFFYYQQKNNRLHPILNEENSVATLYTINGIKYISNISSLSFSFDLLSEGHYLSLSVANKQHIRITFFLAVWKRRIAGACASTVQPFIIL